jgi:adenine-specific DNA-methyltransferase
MPTKKTEISSFKHQDKRVNIPPQELSAFMEDDEKAPKTTLYPRDPSLDPQLVWKGKDEQDQEDLAVPSVPIYIQEKIQPQAIIENVRKQDAKGKGKIGEPEAEYLQGNFFDDFNHIEFKDLVEFYQHEQNWSNRMVLGDSLLVMNSLAEKEGLKGRVQMIYMDPPYGIKFGSNWQSSIRKRDVKDGAESDLTREPEQVKAFRDTWELGIHSYLSYLRDRFTVARELLTESGSVFVQISDLNVHLLRSILDEVFGSENFVNHIAYRTSAPLGSKFIPGIFDHLLWYSKNINLTKFHRSYITKNNESDQYFDTLELEDGSFRKLSSNELNDVNMIPPGAKLFTNITLVAAGPNPNCVFPIEFQGKNWSPTGGRGWKTNQEGIRRVKLANRLYAKSDVLRYKFFLNDFPVKQLTNLWNELGGASDKIYVVQTNIEVIQRCMLMTTDPGDLVLDPTCGSGTTAYVAEQWGRRWITIDTSRVSVALARMRLMTARYPYYLLADSPEGSSRKAEVALAPGERATISPRQARFNHDLRQGFVYQRVPHITLKSIANNEEIDAIHARWQEVMEPLRIQANQALGTHYEEWEIPRPKEEIASLQDASQSQARSNCDKSQGRRAVLNRCL